MKFSHVFLLYFYFIFNFSFGMDSVASRLLKEEVHVLLSFNGKDLQKYIDKENKGYYSNDLNRASEDLATFFKCGNIGSIVNSYDAELIHIAQLVSERNYDRDQLMKALKAYDFKKAGRIVQENPYVKNAYKINKYGRVFTPLSEVVHNDDLFSISFLLSQEGICRNPIADLPLLYLAQDKQALKLLCARGAERKVENSKKCSILTQIIMPVDEKYKYERAHFLLKRFRENCGFNYQACLQKLLYHAVSYAKATDVIEFLLDHTADVLQKTRYGKTPLRKLIHKKDDDIFAVLKRKNILFQRAENPGFLKPGMKRGIMEAM